MDWRRPPQSNRVTAHAFKPTPIIAIFVGDHMRMHDASHAFQDALTRLVHYTQANTKPRAGVPYESASMRRARQQGADGVRGEEDVPGPGGEGSSEVLLDTDEQATLIAELRRKGQQQNRSTRVGSWV